MTDEKTKLCNGIGYMGKKCGLPEGHEGRCIGFDEYGEAVVSWPQDRSIWVNDGKAPAREIIPRPLPDEREK
jgi:hypothetical protein